MEFQLFTLRRTAYLLFVTCAAYAAHYFINAPFTAWLIPVTYTLSLVTSGDTLVLRQSILLLMGLVLVLTSVIASYLGLFNGLLLAYLIILILLYMRYLYPRISNTKVFVLFLFLTIVFANTAGHLESDLERASIIMLGVGIAMVSQLLFWGVIVNDNIERACKTAVVALRKFNAAFFACLMSSDYADNIYEYERQLHLCKRQFYGAISDLRGELPRLKTTLKRLYFSEKATILENIYENVMDYAQIRWRIEDHSSYALCSLELRGLAEAIDWRFKDLDHALRCKGVVRAVSVTFSAALDRMKSVYDSVLSLSVQEPLAILLFVASLQSLDDKISEVTGHD